MTFRLPDEALAILGSRSRGRIVDPPTALAVDDPQPGGTRDGLLAAMASAELAGLDPAADGWPPASIVASALGIRTDAGLALERGVLVACGTQGVLDPPQSTVTRGAEGVSGTVPCALGPLRASLLLCPATDPDGVVGWVAVRLESAPDADEVDSSAADSGFREVQLVGCPAWELAAGLSDREVWAAVHLLDSSMALGLALSALELGVEMSVSAADRGSAPADDQRVRFALAESAMALYGARAAVRVAADEWRSRDDTLLPHAVAARVSAVAAAKEAVGVAAEVLARLGRQSELNRQRRLLARISEFPATELQLRIWLGSRIHAGWDRWDVSAADDGVGRSKSMALRAELAELRRVVRDFVRTRLVPLESQLEHGGGLDEATWAELEREGRSLGLHALGVPEDQGGAGLGMLGQVVVAEQMGHVAVGFRHIIGSPAGAQVLAEFGTDQQRSAYLEPWLAGRRWGGWAATEPEAGSDLGNMGTTAVREGTGWLLNGNKHFITGADRADFFIIFARTTAGVGVKGLTAFLVDKSTTGFSVGREQRMMGRGGLHSYELHLADVAISDEQRLGPVDAGFKVLIGNVGQLRVLMAAHCLGVADRLIRLGAHWAGSRAQFGHPIGEFGALQGYLADSVIELLSCRGATYHAAWLLDEGQEARNETAAVKAMATEMVGRVADRVMQILGGSGYCKDMPVEAIYRAVRLWRIAEGSSEIQRMLLWRGLETGWLPVAFGVNETAKEEA